jgi:mevalonyl-CoA ligase
VAIKDARYGEVVGAFLKCAPGMSRPSSRDIVQWVREVLGSHKSPKYCFWVGDAGVGEDFPKTGSGKYQKHLLRAIGNKLVADGHSAVDMRSKM